MDLASHQRSLLALLKSRDEVAPAADDAYLAAVAGSENLEVLREICVWWRALGIERSCPFTSELLRRRDLFDRAVETYFGAESVSPFVEQQAASFLEGLKNHSDPLLRSVASFELALVRLGMGGGQECVIVWQYDPYEVLDKLLRGEPLELTGPPQAWKTIVSPEIPRHFRVVAPDGESVVDADVVESDARHHPGQGSTS